MLPALLTHALPLSLHHSLNYYCFICPCIYGLFNRDCEVKCGFHSEGQITPSLSLFLWHSQILVPMSAQTAWLKSYGNWVRLSLIATSALVLLWLIKFITVIHRLFESLLYDWVIFFPPKLQHVTCQRFPLYQMIYLLQQPFLKTSISLLLGWRFGKSLISVFFMSPGWLSFTCFNNSVLYCTAFSCLYWISVYILSIIPWLCLKMYLLHLSSFIA